MTLFRTLILSLVFPLFPAHAYGDPAAADGRLNNLPRSYGAESSVYQASWNGIPVASAEMRAVPFSQDGKAFYRVQVEAKTWRYLDWLWKMRDSMESTFEAGAAQPGSFLLQRRENRKKIDVAARFEPGTKKWTVRLQEKGKPKEYEFASAESYDPLSAFYVVRGLDFKEGASRQFEILSGRSRYLMRLNVVGRERISVRAGQFDAYKLEVRVTGLGGSGPRGKARRAAAWISADGQGLALRMESRIFFGSVSIEMIQGERRG